MGEKEERRKKDLSLLIDTYREAGGYVWPKMKEHIIKLEVAYPVANAEFAMISGSDEYMQMAKQTLEVSETAVREKINNLRDKWKTLITGLSDDELLCKKTHWPFGDKPFYELTAWLNLELMKNASEIGYCRFLYASQKR